MNEPRTALEERYTFLELLGTGGASEVHRARDEVLRREVAIKVLKKEYARDEEFVQRFRQEAWSTASLSHHPHIVQVHDMGRSDDGAYYTAMECVEGGTLKDRLLREGTMPSAEVIPVALQIADALRAAHERDIIHRDIKPQNILVGSSGSVKVADFGIARLAASQDTTFGTVLGTADYMSPEQGGGRELGPRSDLYSLGVMLYEMLVGRLPYEADTPIAVVMKHVNEPLTPPRELNPEVPKDLNAVLVKLLAKRPEDRYEDAAGLMKALKATGAFSRTTGAGPPGKMKRERASDQSRDTAKLHLRGLHLRDVGRRLRGRRRRITLIAALASVIISVAALSLYGPPRLFDNAVGATSLSNRENIPEPRSEQPSSQAVTSEANTSGTNPAETFVHRATPESITGNSTYLDDPLLNGEPDSFVSVTQNWNPGERSGVYNDHNVGVWYDRAEERWAIFNQDRADMPEGVSFNVMVWDGDSPSS